jgi:pyrimidine operon attenuation protein/uracil phosphoribosyltransferase
MRELLTVSDALVGLRRMALEMGRTPRSGPGGPLLLVGIRRGGVPLAQHLAQLLLSQGIQVHVGTVDITLYRDDAATALPSPRVGETELPTTVDGSRIVLVDDVLYTGRTVRAALDVLLDHGRPSSVELAVLVDRGGRELPIQPTYVVLATSVPESQRVDVVEVDGGWRAMAEEGPE